MLDLDYLHRAEHPLGPLWRGRLRWVAADAIGCEYSRRYAEADLRRAGLADEALRDLAAGSIAAPPDEQTAIAFARQLTLAAYKVTDEQVAALLENFGPESVVAMVHTVAYANFQDRILLALATEVEEGGPLPPSEAEVDHRRADGNPAPARRDLQALHVDVDPLDGAPRWSARSMADVLQSLEGQKHRQPRIPLPDASRLAKLPPAVEARARRVVWSRVSMGYQPRLTQAWFDTMDTFREEAQLDRVFANTIFWVITRTNDCFY
jgi:hypothetical protein